MALTDKEIIAILEPEVQGLPLQYAIDVSRAISMKRIADFVCGSAKNSDVVDYLSRRMQDVRHG